MLFVLVGLALKKENSTYILGCLHMLKETLETHNSKLVTKLTNAQEGDRAGADGRHGRGKRLALCLFTIFWL